MSRAFVKDAEPALVPAVRAKFPCPPNLQDALLDLRNEGLDQLDSIAAEYNLNPTFLLRSFHNAHAR